MSLARRKKKPPTLQGVEGVFSNEISVLGHQAMQMRCAAGERGVVVFDH